MELVTLEMVFQQILKKFHVEINIDISNYSTKKYVFSKITSRIALIISVDNQMKFYLINYLNQ